VVESIREIIYKTPIKFFEADILSVDISKKEVVTDHGSKPYDMLVVALGATTNFFGTPGAEEYSLVLKDLGNAITLRNQVSERFEAASREKDPEVRKRLLSFVVVGGGATGVELAAELAALCKRTFHKYYRREFPDMHMDITLVQSAPELLPSFDLATRKQALASLAKKQVNVRLNTKVAEVKKDAVVLSSGESIPSSMTVWAAGVRPNSIATTGGEFQKDKAGRVMADATFAVHGAPGVYALGDMANVNNGTDRGYPMLAQVATMQAKHMGKNMALAIAGKPLMPFTFKAKGELVSLGQWEAAGTIGGINLYGRLAWFIWRTVYLFKFISNAKRVKIAVDWTMHLFVPRDVTRI
jgi:NADH dehydrogenase